MINALDDDRIEVIFDEPVAAAGPARCLYSGEVCPAAVLSSSATAADGSIIQYTTFIQVASKRLKKMKCIFI